MGLVEQVRAAGVVGAGGAGFPTHVKVGADVEYVIANGAECEPLMHKDAELMERYADRVVAGIKAMIEATGAAKGIIGIKQKHVEAVEALKKAVAGTVIDIHQLGDFYPTGDEFVLVYETTGRLIPPGGIPLSVGVVVQNVETLYNIAGAVEGIPVTRKFLTVAGAVRRPVTFAAPVGMSFREVIEVTGGAIPGDYAMFVGGAMMGQLTQDLDLPVTKTTTGIIVLPSNHPLVLRKEHPEPVMHRIGKSACDQCSYCTELCPRYLIGYDVQPHKVMRSLVFSMAGEDFWNRWGLLCCGCGLCTLYACPEDLYPKEACDKAKREAGTRGIRWTGTTKIVTPHPMNDSRKIPLGQLVRRLGLTEYDRPAPFSDIEVMPRHIRLPLKQHTGTPAIPVIHVGDRVNVRDVVAEIPEGKLGARIHASIEGVVRKIEPEIIVERGGRGRARAEGGTGG